MGLIFHWQLKGMKWDLPGVPEVENLPSNTGDACLIPGQGLKSPSWSGNQKLTCHGATKSAHLNERSCVSQLRHDTAKNK